jgi:hypothetical protein
MVTITLTEQGMAAMIGVVPDAPRRHLTLANILDRGRFVILRFVMHRIPVRTGNLRRTSGTTFDASRPSARITFTPVNAEGQGYAAYPDQGVAPHVIETRLAAALRFVDPSYAISSGQIEGFTGYQRRTGQAVKGAEDLYIFRSFVFHPGQRAQHFLAGGLDDALPDFHGVMVSEASRMLKVES